MWFYTILFLLTTTLCFLGYFFKVEKKAYILTIIMLTIVAAFRPAKSSVDYEGYVHYYNILSTLPFTFVEPTFFLIAYLSKEIFNQYVGVFVIYAILGVGLKGLAFYRLSNFYYLSLILYVGSFFLLHEMTQIRVGVASGILLLTIPSIANKNKWEFIGWFTLGCLFHYSFFLMGPLYFLDGKKFNKWLSILAILFAFVLFNFGISLISLIQLINLGFISDKISSYQAMLKDGLYGDIQLLNPLLFLRIGIFSVFSFKWKILKQKNEWSVIILKLYGLSIFLFVALADLPALAGRLSQLLGIVEIILLPFLYYILKPRYVSLIFCFLFALLIMYKQLYYSDLMGPYF